MLGAARALLGTEEGFAAILGTGSNSCMYDGKKIVMSMDSMGYVLGDEGSGAHIGKLILKEWLREGFPPSLEVKFFKFCQLDRDQIINRIYHEPNANRFLASFARFAKLNINSHIISGLVTDAFADFVIEVQQRYDLPDKYPMSFTGSIAHYFIDNLESVVFEWGQVMRMVMKSPIEGLVDFHRAT
jgi:N-acetylglucosamine kinase-like BadF-type ATPase